MFHIPTSNVYRCFTFVYVLVIDVHGVIVLCLCTPFKMCVDYPEMLLQFLIAFMCFLYLVQNILPVLGI
jgi:hypothetical protein